MTTPLPTEAELRSAICALPELAGWPEAAGLFVVSDQPVRLDWQLPLRGCMAVGGDRAAALPAMAAVACLQISIILVDDLLDEDPRGRHHVLGVGRAANLALAFQAAGCALLGAAAAAPERRAAAATALARIAVATAYGQDLDVQNVAGEEAYWRVVRAKSTPFYGGGLQIGALLGGADPTLASSLYDFGVLLGEIIQVYDDLFDAFATPANPDWTAGRNNLTILYAATADHPQRARFVDLRQHAGDPQALGEAQAVLLASGAASYCLYQLVYRYQAAQKLLARLTGPGERSDRGAGRLVDPAPVAELLRSEIDPLLRWLPSLGLPIPRELC